MESGELLLRDVQGIGNDGAGKSGEGRSRAKGRGERAQRRREKISREKVHPISLQVAESVVKCIVGCERHNFRYLPHTMEERYRGSAVTNAKGTR